MNNFKTEFNIFKKFQWHIVWATMIKAKEKLSKKEKNTFKRRRAF